MSETRAHAKRLKSSAQKARIVVNEVRGMMVNDAIRVLSYSVKKSAKMIKNVLISAVANAEHNDGLNADDLYISYAVADEGPTLKRSRSRAKGRSARILKRTCHISIGVSEMSRG